jgi:hypothetical protein
VPLAVGDPEQLLDLDHNVVGRAEPAAVHRDRHLRGRLRPQRDARLSPVAPALDAGVDAEDKRGAEEEQADGDDRALRGGALRHTEGGEGAEQDGQRSAPEGGEAGRRVVARHALDAVARDGKRCEQGAEDGERREEEARSALGVAPHGHDLPARSARRGHHADGRRRGLRDGHRSVALL